MSIQQAPRRKIRLVTNILLVIISLISSLITIAAIFVPFIRATLLLWLINQQSWLILLGFFIAGFGTAIISVGIYNYIYSRLYPVRWLLYGYRWVSAEYQYRIDDTLVQHLQEITVTIRATRSGVSIFENKYLWSGQGNHESLEVISPSHELMGSMVRQLPYFPHYRWKYYYIYLGHDIPLGEDVVIKIKQLLIDNEGKFDPYVAKTITEPLKSLKLRVLLPESRPIKNAYSIELNHPAPNNKILGRNSITNRIVRENGTLLSELSYEILEPHLNHRYEIRWEW